MANLLQDLVAWEQAYDARPLADWMRENSDIPFYAAFGYVAFVFWGQQLMKDSKPFNLKPFFIVWNLLLAVFSIRGAVMSVPYFVEHLQANGFRWAICHNSLDWWANGAVGAWMGLFGLSKIPELVDTLFLVLQKKPVILLHWYHHTSVMLYCWFAYSTFHTVGMWFAVMNYVVHSIMYSYYFLMSVSSVTRALVKPIAPLITLMQLAQMVAGLYLVTRVQLFFGEEGGCDGNPRTIIRAALVMYASYFVLFAKFFADSYIFKKKNKPKQQ